MSSEKTLLNLSDQVTLFPSTYISLFELSGNNPVIHPAICLSEVCGKQGFALAPTPSLTPKVPGT